MNAPAPLTTHPRLITLEGGEGAGKTTALWAMREALQAAGHAALCTREPGGTPLAEDIRKLLLHGDGEPVAAHTELLLMFAARVQHVRQAIVPALERGMFVLCDRFTDSSYAYQGGGRGIDARFIADLEQETVGIRPGLTLLLDVDVAVGQARAHGRDGGADRIEREQHAFFQRVRQVFLQRAQAEPERFAVLDASQSPEHVAAQAVARLQAHLRELRA